MNNDCIMGEKESKIYKKVRSLFNDFVDYKNIMLSDKFCTLIKEQLAIELEQAIQILNKGKILYRARIIDNEINPNIGISEEFKGFDKENSFVPPKYLTKAGRLNFAQKPYLYTSEDACSAILEVRPRMGEKVSLAKIKVNEELKFLNCTDRYYTHNQNTFFEAIINTISEELSKPIVQNIETSYFPFQCIAELFKEMNYDGIAYRSAINIEKINYCIFNYNKCEAISSEIFNVVRMEIRCVNEKGEIIQSECIQNSMEYNKKPKNK